MTRNDPIKPKKSLGQNFLKDKNVSTKIVEALELTENDLCLEIGPGMGALTKMLSEKVPRLYAVDYDAEAIAYLNKELVVSIENDRIKLIQSDIRKIKVEDILVQENKQSLKIIGNIPYNLSSEIFFWLFEQSNHIDSVIIMIQKELASRLIAKKSTKDYGILTLALQMVGSAKRLFDVPPTCFYPQPRVMSSIIRLTFPHSNQSYEHFSKMMKLIRTLFSQRRKMIRNTLKNYLSLYTNLKIEDLLEHSPEFIEEILKKRPEQLELPYFEELLKTIESVENK
jgi:16S rRNA (adenine1518-N6/adenine1519-N6)-dimethyltransferase